MLRSDLLLRPFIPGGNSATTVNLSTNVAYVVEDLGELLDTPTGAVQTDEIAYGTLVLLLVGLNHLPNKRPNDLHLLVVPLD